MGVKIANRKVCEMEAQELAAAIQQILYSPKYEALLKAFENDDIQVAKKEFKQLLDEIGIKPNIKAKLKDNAFSNKTVSFKWF